jgi:hypothetical protein
MSIEKYMIKRLHQGNFNDSGAKGKSTKSFKKALSQSGVALPDIKVLPNIPQLKPHVFDPKPTSKPCGCSKESVCKHEVNKFINRKTIVNEM